MSSPADLMREAASALTRLTNRVDPVCQLCGGDATTDPSDHEDGCLIQRLLFAAEFTTPAQKA